MPKTITGRLDHVEHTTSKVTIRTHTLFVDRTAANDGLDRGPTGGEYLITALGGCFTSHLLAAIRARVAPLTNVSVDVTGTLDGSPEHFVAFSLDVNGDGATPELGRKLVTVAARGCQVLNTLKPVAPIALSFAGSPVELPEEVAVA
ncbi:MAG TPA: OsmC family protein [Gemmatimonadaceae bacterium]|jgi:putative redox protein